MYLVVKVVGRLEPASTNDLVHVGRDAVGSDDGIEHGIHQHRVLVHSETVGLGKRSHWTGQEDRCEENQHVVDG